MSRQFSIALLLFCLVTACQLHAEVSVNTNAITRETVADAQTLIGLDFPDTNLDQMLPGLRERRDRYARIHKFPLSNAIPPVLEFNPIPAGTRFESVRKKFNPGPLPKVKLPANLDDLAFYSIPELASLLKSRQITSEKLTQFFLERLKKYGPKLECVVTLTEECALAQARRADAEIAAGKYRGLLHGIPYGAKDLLATKGIPATWGAAPYTNQVFDEDATVIQRLEEAGAVLVAKLTLGELAMGEHWYGGMTRNPWNLKQGSSGSSAGPAAATSAGLVPFAIGSETYGSIVSPSDRCGVTGLRPTFGRVSRAGAMTLSWSMDKLGPIARSAGDCAIVFNAIYGPDGIDQTVVDVPFNYDVKARWQKWRIGYLKKDFDKETGTRKANDAAALEKLRALGAELVPIELPDFPIQSISFIISAEGAAAFDDLTRSGRDALLAQQSRGSWPNIFRQARFVPAVEYLQANRIRYLLIQETAKCLKEIDVFVAPTFEGDCYLLSNLTGHPCVAVPNGFNPEGAPTSICFLGNLFKEAEVLAVAKAYQDATGFHLKHPKLDLN